MKKHDFQKGVISVFLVIVLVPCIVIASTFVDLSRVKLAQGVATSAADLSLNSLMSYYDTDLNDFYGMMASCQTIEEFYEESANFFLDALYSQGLEADEIDSLIALWNDIVGDDSVYDLLDMEVQSSTDEIISSVKGASLGESSVIMRDQIVEFSKYRAPIEITKGIVDRLKSSGAADALADADENEELIEDKQEYAEEKGDLLDKLYKTYKAIIAYEDTKASLTVIKDMSNRFDNYRTTYEEINRYMVSNFSNTSGLTQFTRPTFKIDQYKDLYSKDKSSVYSKREKDEDGTFHYYVNNSKMQTIFNEMDRAISAFNTKKTEVCNNAGSLIDSNLGEGTNQDNPIQWWVQINKALGSSVSSFSTAAQNMLKAYDRLLAMHDCEMDEDVPSDWENRYNELKSKVENLQAKYLVANKTDSSDKYLRLVNKLESTSRNYKSKIDPTTFKLSNGKTIGATVSEISTKLKKDKENLKKYIDALDKVINGYLFDGTPSLDSLKNDVKEYNTALNNWKNTATTTDTDLGEADRDEIAGIKNGQVDPNDKIINITETDVTNLKTRLVNIRSQFINIRDTIDTIKYCGKKLVDIASFDTARNAVNSKIGDVPLKNSAITTKATNLFNEQFKPKVTGKIYTVNESPDYNPDLTVSGPTLYSWMKKEFKDVNDSEVKKKKEEVDGKKDEADADKAKEAEKAKTDQRTSDVSNTNIYGGSYSGSEFPSGLDKASPYKLGESFIQSISGLVNSLVEGKFTNIRDSLYSTEYVMDMFSYATYNNEGKYNLYKQENNGKAPTSTANYTSVAEKWKSKAITDTYNKTLTNKMIDSGNNVAFGAEVEYILYGDTNKGSITSAYADIYGIRYLLNTISGFQQFWTATNNKTAGAINALAVNIAGITSGIIPVPLTKSVAILLLTVFETAKDLDRLADGFPVELYKKDHTYWRLTLSGWGQEDNKDATDSDIGLFYSDYLYLFLYLGFESKSASEMYLRIGDVMQANMRKLTKDNSYTLKKARTYFKIDATIRVKPLLLTAPLVQSYGGDNPAQTTDWCTFKISQIRGYS